MAGLNAWKTAACLSDRARRAIRERRLVGESIDSLAEDYSVPVAFVTYLCSWQMFGDKPQPPAPDWRSKVSQRIMADAAKRKRR